ncbi:MAG: glucuronate isomerase [Bacteroidota bacterium]
MSVYKIQSDYLLSSDWARELYEAIKDLPVIDYFTRLSPAQLSLTGYRDINQLWISDDPLKSKFLGKQLDGEDLFEAWVKDLQKHLLHPIYACSHLELSNYWEIDEFLTPSNAQKIYHQLQEKLAAGDFGPESFMEKSCVSSLYYLADPIDDLLEPSSESYLHGKVSPIFAPIKTLIVDDATSFNQYLDQLSSKSGFQLEHYIDLLNALQYSMDAFEKYGCKFAHHRLELMYAEPYTQEQVNFIFHKIRLGHELFPDEKAKFRSALLHHLTEMYHERGWVQQFHLGTIRQLKGIETGFDAMGDDETAWYLLRYLHEMTQRQKLPKTIFHHPYKSKLLASIASKFHGMLPPGWIQVRPGWELLTHREELVQHMKEISFPSLNGAFPGMPSSASVWPSLARHDYVKRVLSQMLAHEVDAGSLPADKGLLVSWLSTICSQGGKDFLGA